MFTNILEEYYEKINRQLSNKKISQEKYNRLLDTLYEWEDYYYEIKMEEEN